MDTAGLTFIKAPDLFALSSLTWVFLCVFSGSGMFFLRRIGYAVLLVLYVGVYLRVSLILFLDMMRLFLLYSSLLIVS